MRPHLYACGLLLRSRDEFRRNASRAANGFAVNTAWHFASTQGRLDELLRLLERSDSETERVEATATEALDAVLGLERWLPAFPGRFAELKAVLYEFATHDHPTVNPVHGSLRRSSVEGESD